MNKIHRFNNYSKYDDMSRFFIDNFDKLIKESTEHEYQKVEKKVLSDLKINLEFIATFGAGINTFYPIVTDLLFNQGNIEVTTEGTVLATICAIAIIYLEEKKARNSKEEKEITDASKSMLEELKLKGIGNGIVKRIIKAFKSIQNIFSKIGKYLGKVALGFTDMFAYTALLIPVMNGINAIINQYDLNLETIVQNLIGVGLGIGTIVAKNGIIEIVKRLRNKIPKNKEKEIITDLVDDIEVEPIIKKFGELHDEESELIKEQ